MKKELALVILAAAISNAIVCVWTTLKKKRQVKKLLLSPVVSNGISGLVGNTPIIKLENLSRMVGCSVYAKMEYLSPGGCSKDRLALSILENAEQEGLIVPGQSVIYEATTGSTGISLCVFALQKGYRVKIYMPSDISEDKVKHLKILGAQVQLVDPLPYSDRRMYVHAARDASKSDPNGFFADQFETAVNWQCHYKSTAPEIHRQMASAGGADFIVLGAGTSGTIAGVSKYFKSHCPSTKVVLADPVGSGLYNKVKCGVLYASTEKEGSRRRNQVDSVVEGIGINRITSNFLEAQVDDAISVTDQEAVDMSRFILSKEGLFVGSSSAVNLVAAVRTAMKHRGCRVVTFLCDSGSRHLSKFWNDEFLLSKDIQPDAAFWGRSIGG
jgi:cysteine synthase A